MVCALNPAWDISMLKDEVSLLDVAEEENVHLDGNK